MIKLLRTVLCIGVFLLGLLSTAHANLHARAGGMVYDDVLRTSSGWQTPTTPGPVAMIAMAG